MSFLEILAIVAVIVAPVGMFCCMLVSAAIELGKKDKKP